MLPISRTTLEPPAAAPSRLRRASTPARCSSPMTRVSTSSRPATPQRWSNPTGYPTSMRYWMPTGAGYANYLTTGYTFLPKSPMEGHNTWCANRPGSTLLIPVGDIAQHMIAVLCFMVQNGYALYDDVNGELIPGLERYSDLVDLEEPLPLTFMETYSITECTAELSTSCYAGMLMLQAMGLGGWMFDGIDRYTVLGASGDPEVPGLGFRYDTDKRWPLPNPTGLPGVFAGYCPPHYPDMRAAVEAFAERKFGPGGPFHPDTPGPWKESTRVRSSAQVHSEEFKECVAIQAQHIF